MTGMFSPSAQIKAFKTKQNNLLLMRSSDTLTAQLSKLDPSMTHQRKPFLQRHWKELVSKI